MIYSHSGEELDPRDVLDGQELREYDHRERAHSFKAPRSPAFPELDADTGLDAEGWAWGARTYGGAR